jgi:hypothetical protein
MVRFTALYSFGFMLSVLTALPALTPLPPTSIVTAIAENASVNNKKHAISVHEIRLIIFFDPFFHKIKRAD